MLLSAALSCFVVALLAPALIARIGARGGLLLALLPAGWLAWMLLAHGADISAGGALLESRPWIPGLGIEASLRLDGLSLLMAGLILGIGTLVLIYASSYLATDSRQGRFYGMVLAFMGAMLGLVLSDDILLLFVFWELTSITSFLLIGHDHEDEKARKSAFQGLFVTVAGGLVLMAGLIVLGNIAGSYSLSAIVATPDLHEAPKAGLALGLIVIGCFTKSAQFPFHFWLPNAMAAPTPVSAYLHSATMVKAGVYLLARLHPSLGEHAHWFWWLAPIGCLTMLTGAWLAFNHSGFKAVLAYTTVMALGTLTMLLGPALLGLGSVTFGLFPHLAERGILQAAAQAAGAPAEPMELALWHGFNLPLALSLCSLFAAGLVYLAWPRVQPHIANWPLARFGPEAAYWRLQDLIAWSSRIQTDFLQNGYLRYYVLTVLSVLLLLTGGTLLVQVGIPWPSAGDLPLRLVPALVAALVLVAALAALRSTRALSAVLALGAVGFGVALLYVWFSAPDLAITQVLIETLTTVLLVLVLFRMPRFRRLSSRLERLRDGFVALGMGLLMAALIWMVMGESPLESISTWLLAESVPGGHGRNVVNVILVDFRALDTLGEIFVLALAAVGVYALLRGQRDKEPEERA